MDTNSVADKSRQGLLREISELREQLAEARETLHAIRNGHVDAFVVSGAEGEHIYTLKSADYTYRILVESMHEGALVLAPDGTILYCNRRFAEMIERLAEKLVGSSILAVVDPADQDAIKRLLRETENVKVNTELHFKAANGISVPVLLAVSPMTSEDTPLLCMVVFDLTERKQTQETQRLLAVVQEEKERLSALVNSMTDEVWYADARKKFSLLNPSALREFGFPSPIEIDVEALAANLEVYRPDGSPRPVEEAPPLRALRGEVVRNQEELLRTPRSGALRWRRVSAAPIRNVLGQVTGAVCVARDVTDHKQSEEALRESEARFKLLSETAGRLLTATDARGIVNGLCRQVMEHLDCHAFFNFMVDEEVGRLRLNTCGGIPEEEVAKIQWLDFGVAVCGCAARDGCRIVAENIATTPDPRTELVKSYGIQAYACHPLMAEGRVIGTLSFGTKTRTCFSPQDLALMKIVADQVATAMERIRLIANLKQARDELELRVYERTRELLTANEILGHREEQINQARLMLQTVFDAISDPLLMVGKDYRIMMCNQVACEYLRLASREDAYQKTCHELARGRFEPCDHCLVHAAILDGEALSYERTGLVDPDRFEEVTVYPVDEAAGGVAGAVIHITDVTRSRNMEGLLVRADRLSSLGMLAGGIAHEIRNPLAAIKLFVDLLNDEEKFSRSSQESSVLGEISFNIKKIDSIIKRVLDFSKQPTTSDWLNLEQTALIQDSLKLWQSRIAKDGIQLNLFVEEGVSEIHGDPIEMQQVMMNLIQNAIEAMEQGGTLSISARNGTFSFDQKRPAVLITVQDTGSGIPRERQKKIFNPFFTTKMTGTGLGLAISHRIVSRHGGMLSFKSTPGVGTTFLVELPAAPKNN